MSSLIPGIRVWLHLFIGRNKSLTPSYLMDCYARMSIFILEQKFYPYHSIGRIRVLLLAFKGEIRVFLPLI
jgi:hypothetical protein